MANRTLTPPRSSTSARTAGHRANSLDWNPLRSSSGAATLAAPEALIFPGSRGFGAGDTRVQPLAASALRGWLGVFAELFKARLTFLVLVTTLVGFYMGAHGETAGWLMLHTLLGTALVAAGASALNQWWERDYDACMRRTRSRPLPAGLLQASTVLAIGISCAAAGLVYLAIAVNPATCGLGAASLLSYILLYTPLKRKTWLNTAVGAIPGGLPPLMGWTAAHGRLSAEGWTLFGILALWQLPHFMAIAWIYRDEYARAGFKMLPVIDPSGARTSRHALIQTLLLLPLSLCPYFLGMTGPLYLYGALVLGAAFVWHATRFWREATVTRARQLFLISILYLPVLLVLMAVARRGQ
jgi:protoheme IX farnesyltransferase